MNTYRVTPVYVPQRLTPKEFLHALVAAAMTLALLYLFTVVWFTLG